MSLASYRRNDLKQRALDEISKEMDMPADIIKKKLKSLRTTYIAEKKKVAQKVRSGCSVESLYVPSIPWFGAMSFLDDSIAVRKSTDNSSKSNTSFNVDDIIEYVEDSVSTCPSSSSTAIAESGFDEALKKLLEVQEKEDEFCYFGKSIACQLRKLPVDKAYAVMAETQEHIRRMLAENSSS